MVPLAHQWGGRAGLTNGSTLRQASAMRCAPVKADHIVSLMPAL